jgi:hypothetical protein
MFLILSFSGSCLVSSSLSEVCQFNFAYCPQVQEISSVVHQLSCLGGSYSLYLFTGGLFLCLIPFLCGKVSDPSASLLLSACCDGSLFVFQFCRVIWLWVLLTGSGDELCGLLPALLQTVAYHPPAVSPPAFPAICLLIVCVEISSLPHPPSPVSALFVFLPPLLCASFQFIVYCTVFCFCWGGWGVSLPRGLCWFISGVAGGMLSDAWHSPVWSAKCLPSRFGDGGWWQQQPSCFLSVTWHGEAFYRLGVL